MSESDSEREPSPATGANSLSILVADESPSYTPYTNLDFELDATRENSSVLVGDAAGSPAAESPSGDQTGRPQDSSHVSRGSSGPNAAPSNRPQNETVLNVQQSWRPGVDNILPAEIMYHGRARLIQNPLLPPRPCHALPTRVMSMPGNHLSIVPGSDRSRLVQEKNHFRQYRSRCAESAAFNPNPAAVTPPAARPNPHTRAGAKSRCGHLEMGWKEREERLKDWRDHKLAEEIGYETLVGNLLYIDIPRGRDINRSWENFLSHDVMEWGFPYYKGSRERPRVKQREPYLAHQLKEKMWKYPKARVFHSVAED